MKTRTFSNVDEVAAGASGVKFYAPEGSQIKVEWVTVNKAWNDDEGWMKSTKVMEIGKGCLVQVTTQQRNLPDIAYTIAEALTFVPGVKLTDFIVVANLSEKGADLKKDLDDLKKDLLLFAAEEEPDPEKEAEEDVKGLDPDTGPEPDTGSEPTLKHKKRSKLKK